MTVKTIEQQSLFDTPQTQVDQAYIDAHNRQFQAPPANPYATNFDSAIHGVDVRDEVMLRLRTLLHQQYKRITQSSHERGKFFQILANEIHLKQTTQDGAFLVRNALTAFHGKNERDR